MPRNLAGDFNLVLGNPVAPGTVIESNWANSTLNDVAAGLTESLSRSGNGGMLVPLKHTAGSAGSPSVTFLNDLKSGLYLPSNGTVIMSVGAVNRQRWTSTTVEFWNVNTSQWEKALTTGNIGPLLNINGDTADPLTNSANLKFNLSSGINEGAVGAFNDDLNEIALASASGGAVSLRHGGTLSNARRVRTQATGARLYGDGATSTILDLYAQANDATAVAKIQFNRFDGTTPTVAGSLGLNASATLLLDNPLDRVALTHTGTVRWATTTQGTLLNENVEFISGVGSPEGVVSANAGAWYADTSNGDHYYKTGTGNAGWVALTGDLDVKSAISLGTGEPVYAQEVANEFQFKSLIAGTRIGLVSTSDDITLSTTAELNTASNLGLGEGVYAQKVGEDLQFKSIVAGVNVSIGSDANEITISASLDSATFTTPALITGTGVGDANQASVKFLEVDGSTVQAELGQLDATSTTTLKSYVGDITLDAFSGVVNIINDLVSVGSITAGTDVIATGDVSGATLTVSGLATLDSLSVTNNATVGGDLTVTGTINAALSAISPLNIQGSGTGNANTSVINFNESDNTTQVGFIGDIASADQDFYVGANIGAVKLVHTPGTATDTRLATSLTGVQIFGDGIDSRVDIYGAMNTNSMQARTLYIDSDVTVRGQVGFAGASYPYFLVYGLDEARFASDNSYTALTYGGIVDTDDRLRTQSTGVQVIGREIRHKGIGSGNVSGEAIQIMYDGDGLQLGYTGWSKGKMYFINSISNSEIEIRRGPGGTGDKRLETQVNGVNTYGRYFNVIGTGTVGTDSTAAINFYDGASNLLGWLGPVSTATDIFYIASSRTNTPVVLRHGGGSSDTYNRIQTDWDGAIVSASGRPASVLRVKGPVTGTGSAEYVRFVDAADAVQGYIGLTTGSDNHFRILSQLGEIWLYASATLRFQVTSSGTHTTGNITATGTISDERIKTNVTPISDSLSLIKSIPVYNYDRKDTGQNLDGIMMQDIKDKIQGAVIEGPEIEGYGGANLYPNYLPLIAHLIRSIQQLNDEIESLKKAA